MENTNGAQGQPGFAGQQTANARGMNPSMPINNNNSRAPPVMFGEFHRQQGPSQAQPQLYGQQTVNGNRVPINFGMRTPNNNGVPMPMARNNTQINQQALPVRPGFGVPQMMGNSSRGHPAMAAPTNANAINGFARMYSSGHQQPYAQSRAPQNHQARQNQQASQNQQAPQSQQALQYHQARQNYQARQIQQAPHIQQPAQIQQAPQFQQPAQIQQVSQNQQAARNQQASQYHQAPQTYLGGESFNAGTGQTNYQTPLGHNSFNGHPVHPPSQGANTSSGHLVGHHNGAQPSQNASLPTSNVSNAERSQTPLAAETPEEFLDRVADLVAEKATAFKAYIQNDADFDRYEAAIWKAKRKGDDLKDMSQGSPTDEASRSAVKQRIFDAFLKTDGDQDPASDSDNLNNCLAVRTIQKLSDVELEILAHKFTVSTIVILTITIANRVTNTDSDAQSSARRRSAGALARV